MTMNAHGTGLVPDIWKLETLGSQIKLAYGSGLTEGKRSGDGYPVCGSNGVVGYHNKYLVEGPGIIVGRKGSIGAINWLDANFHPIDTTYYVQTKSPGISLRWLYYKLSTLGLERLNTASGTPGLNRSEAYRLLVAFPPPEEQSRIASILHQADRAVLESHLMVEKLKRLKRGLMQDLFRYGIDQDGRIRSEATHRFKDSPLGRIPEEWEAAGLFETCKLINGRPFKPEEWAESGLPIIRIENLNDPDANYHYCDFEVPAKYLIRSGDLLISWSGTPATSFGIFVWDRGNAVLNQHIFKAILSENVDTQYFYFAYQNMLDEMIRQSHGGVGLQHITKEDLKQLRLVIPKQSEQSRIASVLSQADGAMQQEETFRQKLLAIKRGLMDDLLSGKVRVNHLIDQN